MKGLPPEDTRVSPKFEYRIGVNGDNWMIKTTTLEAANKVAKQLFDGGSFKSVEIYDTKGHVVNVIRKD
jgi:hypothetical protein